jgi:type II secretory pathway pseudopilin PulG
LIEVLLALTILGLGLLVLLTTASRCLGVAKQARHYEHARQLIGRLEVEQLLDTQKGVEEGTEDGRFEPPFEAYRWSRTIEQAGLKEDDGLYRVRLRVAWAQASNSAEEVETYLYLPEAGKTNATGR